MSSSGNKHDYAMSDNKSIYIKATCLLTSYAFTLLRAHWEIAGATTNKCKKLIIQLTGVAKKKTFKRKYDIYTEKEVFTKTRDVSPWKSKQLSH